MKIAKFTLQTCASVPLFLNIPYLRSAFDRSPVDRMDMLMFGVAAFAFGIIAVFAKLQWRGRVDKPLWHSRAILVMLVPIVVYAVGAAKDINAFRLLGAVGIAWTMAWGLYGREFGLMLIPSVICACLAVPGLMFWLTRLPQCFSGVEAEAFYPEFTVDWREDLFGREIDAYDEFGRLFQTSDVKRFAYSSPTNSVWVLSMAVGSDVHEVRSSMHCFKSYGWAVEREELRMVTLPDSDRTFQVMEVEVVKGLNRSLVWVWYSSKEKSTGAYINFRRLYSPGAGWKVFQVKIDLGDSTNAVETARSILARFLDQ